VSGEYLPACLRSQGARATPRRPRLLLPMPVSREEEEGDGEDLQVPLGRVLMIPLPSVGLFKGPWQFLGNSRRSFM